MMRIAVIMASLAILCLACEDEPTPLETTSETFRGTFAVHHPSMVGGDKKDSVSLYLTNNRDYVLSHFSDIPCGVQEICDTSGGVSGFGTSLAIFTPEYTASLNCDTLRIPTGRFNADFRNHGDTIYLDRTSGDSTFSFRLLPE